MGEACLAPYVRPCDWAMVPGDARLARSVTRPFGGAVESQVMRHPIGVGFDFGWRASYSWHMGRSRPLLALVLTVAVSAAGVACACAVPAFGSSDAGHAHHSAGHHGAEAATQDDCLHVDCGDCSADGVPSRHSASTPPPDTSLDEVAFTGTHLLFAPRMLAPSCRPPPLPLARPADSPVRRFDRMLD